MTTRPSSAPADYERVLATRRIKRAWNTHDHKHKRREYQWAHREAMKHAKHHVDMCEDSGLVFMLPSLLNTYSVEYPQPIESYESGE